MSIYVYTTRQCAKDAKTQGYNEIVENFAKEVERSQRIDRFEPFPPPHLKKRFERQIRLIASAREVGEHTVVVFLRLFLRGGSEYQQFKNSKWKVVPGVDRLEDEISDSKLNDYITSRQDPPPPPPPAPNEVEDSYLLSALEPAANPYHDSHCCETDLWVERIQQPEFSSRLSVFVDPILDTIDHQDEGLSEIRCKSDNSFGILFRRIPDANMVILFTPFRGNAPLDEIRTKFGSLVDSSTPFDHEQGLKRAKRAYSHDLILNEDAWFEIQKDSEGSMALSPEEVAVLESARDPQGNGFPLFINGRAGSGKSTILQYLFSEYLYHYLLGEHAGGPPLLFACNDLLLSQARKSVRQLLKARHKKSKGAVDDSWLGKPGFEERFDSAFRNFYTSLLSLLPPQDLDRFPRSNMVDYGRFKSWWERRFSKDPSSRKLYDPDISWHVIRTYIKGTSPEGLLDPDDYLEIPAKEKTVTPESYGIIFDKVWSKYAEDQHEKGLWDHQDLARHVIDHDLVKPIHPVLLCDEAQDFTRIELEIIDRHCLFNARTLQRYQAERIPIAFAGDPFQTLNPTGFRWESTKAFFVEKFIKSYSNNGGKRELNFRELSYNYRSSRNIVRFCNTLQLVRSVVFDIRDIRPQLPWHEEEDSPSVVCFDRANMEILDILKNQSEIRIIVPCEEGMEAEWVRQNGLAEFVEFDDEDVPKNVVSAIRVKGLEFPRVVLFGFGGACPSSLRIEPQYFLNRLYVAASRPRRRLFVIDHKKDIESFWNPIFERQDSFVLNSYDIPSWEDELGGMLPGDAGSWEKDREDPAETAKKLAEEGRLRKDRVLLRQAALSYETANSPSKAKRCRAEALEFEEEWLKAAKLWEELGDHYRAVDAAWQSSDGGHEFILELAKRQPVVAATLEYRFADYLSKGGNFELGIELLRVFQDAIEDEKRLEKIVAQPSWRREFGRFVDAMLKAKDSPLGLTKAAYARLRNISESGMRIPPLALGKLAYAADLLTDAYKHWSVLNPPDRSGIEREYLRAKVAVSAFPDYVEDTDELLRNHRAMMDAEKFLERIALEDPTKLKSRHHLVVARAQLIAGKPEDGIPHLALCSDEKLSIEYLKALSEKSNDPSQSVACLRILLPIMAKAHRLPAMLELMKTGRYGSGKLVEFSRLLNRNSKQMLLPMVEVISQDPSFDTEGVDVQTGYSRFLKEQFPADLSWRHEIHPILIGSALEQIGMFKETLPFYELLRGSNLLSSELRNLAKERWIRVKIKQALRERDHGNRKKGESHLEEAINEFAGLPYSKFDEIPENLPDILPPVDPTHDEMTSEADVPESLPAEETTVIDSEASNMENYKLASQISDFKLSINPAGTRMNIEHAETLEQLAIRLDDSSLKIDGDAVEAESDGRYLIDSWGLTVDLSRVGEGEVTLVLKNGMKTSLPVAPSPKAKTGRLKSKSSKK
jgi:hypothetical protein